MTIKKTLLFSFFFIGFVFALAQTSFADVPTNNSIQGIMDIYKDAASSWAPILVGYANRIFFILAAIDIAWMAIMLALNPGEFSDFVANLVRKVIFLGFFLALLINGSSWAGLIVRSLTQAGGAANSIAGGTFNVTPALVFDTGFQLCSQIFSELSAWEPIDSLAIIIGGIIIMICFALISAMMLLMYVQGYVIIYAGVILLGFGGSTFTKDIALKYFQAALAVGAKLFVMILLVGLGQTIINSWTAVFTLNLSQIVLFIGASIVLLALVKEVPNMVGDLINGFSWGTGESLSRTTGQLGKAAIGGMVGAAVGAAGGTMAVTEAAKLAHSSGGGGFANTVKGTVTNLAKAGAQDVASRVSGEQPPWGTTGGRMASNLKEQRLRNPSTKSTDEPYISEARNVKKEGSISKDEKA